jgi:tryptophanyl-tRNA synthetase
VTAKKGRVLSGMRPTGRLHIGHFFGALENWIKLQDEYECFYFVADWHALTSDYADTSQIARNTVEIGIDWLAAGLDPRKSTLFVQSQVPEHAELHLLLSMVTPLGWLERVPTYKEALENVKDKDLHTYGFLGYPLLQTADIVIYDADFVPVGEDQVPHVEMSREIVRRFNTAFGFEIDDAIFSSHNQQAFATVLDLLPRLPQLAGPVFKPDLFPFLRTLFRNRAAEVGLDNFLEQAGSSRRFFACRPVLDEPQVLLTETPRIPGTDGRKMSKSYGNVIELGESDESIRTKARGMMTDPKRTHRHIPGNPEVCPVFAWHKLFSPKETIAWSDQGCRTAAIGCIECKAAMADNLVKWIEPIRARRKEYEAQPGRVLEILSEGSKKARKVAQATMERVREAIFHWQQLESEMRGKGASKPAAGER